MAFVKVRQDGSILIPVNLRQRFGVKPGAWYRVEVNAAGDISYAPETCVCSICGAKEVVTDSITGACGVCQYVITNRVRDGESLSGAIEGLRATHRRRIKK